MSNFKYEVHASGGKNTPLVSVVMGSQSDWETMRCACEILDYFCIYWERRIISAHHTPKRLDEFCNFARSGGLGVIIVGAGGAAHLPGMIASFTTLPVHAVPIKSSILQGVDSLLSIVQMPKGVPVGTFSIGDAGAVNAALQAVRVLSLMNTDILERLNEYIRKQTASVPEIPTD